MNQTNTNQGNPPSPCHAGVTEQRFGRAKAGFLASNFWPIATTPEEEVVVADLILPTAIMVTCVITIGACLLYIFSKEWPN